MVRATEGFSVMIRLGKVILPSEFVVDNFNVSAYTMYSDRAVDTCEAHSQRGGSARGLLFFVV